MFLYKRMIFEFDDTKSEISYNSVEIWAFDQSKSKGVQL